MLADEIRYLMDMYDVITTAEALVDSSPFARKNKYKDEVLKLLQSEEISKKAAVIIFQIYDINHVFNNNKLVEEINSLISSSSSKPKTTIQTKPTQSSIRTSTPDPCSRSSFSYSSGRC